MRACPCVGKSAIVVVIAAPAGPLGQLPRILRTRSTRMDGRFS